MLTVLLQICAKGGALKRQKFRKLESQLLTHNIERRGCGGKRDHTMSMGKRNGYSARWFRALIFLLAKFLPSPVWKLLPPSLELRNDRHGEDCLEMVLADVFYLQRSWVSHMWLTFPCSRVMGDKHATAVRDRMRNFLLTAQLDFSRMVNHFLFQSDGG